MIEACEKSGNNLKVDKFTGEVAKALANQLETDKGKGNQEVAAKALGELFASLPIGEG